MSMTVGPWIKGHSVLSLGANRLKITGGEGLEDLAHGSMMWQGCMGCRPTWPSGPKAPCHMHLPPCSCFALFFL
jgi:hypothetical protein